MDRGARDRLFEEHHRWAVGLAGKCKRPAQVMLAEVEQEARVALLEAVGRFDGNLGARFRTYAGTIIRRRIQDYLRSVSHYPNALRRGDKARARRDAVRLARKLRARGVDTDADAEFSRLYHEPEFWSLSTPLVPDSSITFHDHLAAETPLPDEGLELFDAMRTLWRRLPRLDRQEFRVVYHRLHGETLRRIGKRIKRTESRASQVLSQAIAKLRRGEIPPRLLPKKGGARMRKNRAPHAAEQIRRFVTDGGADDLEESERRLTFRVLNGDTLREIAADEHVAPSTVSARWGKLVRKVRQLVEKRADARARNTIARADARGRNTIARADVGGSPRRITLADLARNGREHANLVEIDEGLLERLAALVGAARVPLRDAVEAAVSNFIQENEGGSRGSV